MPLYLSIVFVMLTFPFLVKATRDFQKAMEHNQQSHEAHDGMRRAQRLLKMAKRKDYYKILEVPKTATLAEIKKSFRKLALKYHPDKVRLVDAKMTIVIIGSSTVIFLEQGC
jgi:DnaJ-domain-containing protein 1